MQGMDAVLKEIPDGLRKPLLHEYRSIVDHFILEKWQPSELSGGLFCEIVFTILEGYRGKYADKPNKPNNIVEACRLLEKKGKDEKGNDLKDYPRSFRILVPRMLPPLYEIRNNRGVGHTGGDVDSNLMDASAVLYMSSWIMAELIRVFHNVSTADAQAIVDSLIERRVPLVWTNGDMKRVLDPDMNVSDQIRLLLYIASRSCSVSELQKWVDYKNKNYFRKLLNELHDSREIELNGDEVLILPPGQKYVESKLLRVATNR